MVVKSDKTAGGETHEPKGAAPNSVDRTREQQRLFALLPFELHVERVLDGRKFDTDTATLACVIARTRGSQLTDFHYEQTGLYRSPRSQFFLAGEGGALSRWGRRAQDGSRQPGEGIELVSETEARRLLEQHDGPVEAFFESEEG